MQAKPPSIGIEGSLWPNEAGNRVACGGKSGKKKVVAKLPQPAINPTSDSKRLVCTTDSDS